MKKVLMVIALTLMLGGSANAGNVGLAWDPSPSTDVSHYRIYRSDTSGVYVYGGATSPNFVVEVPATELSYTDTVGDGVWFYTGTAVDITGNESVPSNECSTTIDDIPLPPGTFGCTQVP